MILYYENNILMEVSTAGLLVAWQLCSACESTHKLITIRQPTGATVKTENWKASCGAIWPLYVAVLSVVA